MVKRLTLDAVMDIRTRWLDGETAPVLAREHDISIRQVYRVVNSDSTLCIVHFGSLQGVPRKQAKTRLSHEVAQEVYDKLVSEQVTMTSLAKEYNTSVTTIYNLYHGYTHKRIKRTHIT